MPVSVLPPARPAVRLAAMDRVPGDVTFREESPEPSEFLRLFRTTGWTTSLPDERLVAALGASWHCVCAYHADTLVGMGRTISDGSIHALIVEVIVDPEWQGRGIGREVMRRLVDRCRRAGIDQVQLFCAAGKSGFYESVGFAARPADAPGMELIQVER